MVKTEANEMMNNYETLVLYSRLWCVYTIIFHVQLCLQSWSTHVKGIEQFFCPHFITTHLSIYQSIAENCRGSVDDYVVSDFVLKEIEFLWL